MTTRISLLTIESDSADPSVMAAIRELLERFGAGAVVLTPIAAAAAPGEAERQPDPAAVELGRRGGKKGGAAPPPIIWEPPATSAAPEPSVGTHGTRRVEHAIRELIQAPPRAPVPPVVAVTAPVLSPAAPLGERIMKAVKAQPGTSVPMLAQLLLGGADQAKVRELEAGLQPLVMRSEVYRANGRVFPSVKSAAAAPAAVRVPGPQAVQQVDQKPLYDKLVAAYAKRNNTPTSELARLLFGEPTGITISKVKLMTKQLCASERLKRTAWDSFRPWDEKQDRATDDEDEADDSAESEGEDAGDEKSADLESNGQPDENDDLEELDVG